MRARRGAADGSSTLPLAPQGGRRAAGSQVWEKGPARPARSWQKFGPHVVPFVDLRLVTLASGPPSWVKPSTSPGAMPSRPASASSTETSPLPGQPVAGE